MPILHWLTRDRDVKAADAVPYRLLERDAALSASAPGSGNMLIQGDNLEALKSLLPNYRGQVKCIYIDPPYNTRSAVSVHYDDTVDFISVLTNIAGLCLASFGVRGSLRDKGSGPASRGAEVVYWSSFRRHLGWAGFHRLNRYPVAAQRERRA